MKERDHTISGLLRQKSRDRIVRRCTTSLLSLVLGVTLSGCASQTPGVDVLSEWKSFIGAAGGTRDDPHAGMDFGGDDGSPVLAAADGVVHEVHGHAKKPRGCGLGVTLYHAPLDRWTVYCHLSRALVRGGQVRRGQTIGLMGTSGSSRDVPHLHFEVVTDAKSHRDGDTKNTEDPAPLFAGCFRPGRTYPDRKLTYPVPCRD